MRPPNPYHRLARRAKLRLDIGGRTHLVVAAGVATASSLLLLLGLSELALVLGFQPWQAHLLSGCAGLAGAAGFTASHRSSAVGLTPAQALSQLRNDLSLDGAAERRFGDDAGRLP